jgi:hypothetical protein
MKMDYIHQEVEEEEVKEEVKKKPVAKKEKKTAADLNQGTTRTDR